MDEKEGGQRAREKESKEEGDRRVHSSQEGTVREKVGVRVSKLR